MELWQLWLLFTIPSLGKLFGFVAGVTGVLSLFSCVGFVMVRCAEVTKEDISWVSKTCYAIWALFLFMTTLSALIPNRQDLMLIVGGYAATNIEGVEKLPPNLVKAANKYLEELVNPSE